MLAEQGWPAVTTRAVAERAGANVGLIHYHFGGLAELRMAITRRAVESIVGPVLANLLGAADESSAVEALREVIPATAGDARAARLATELLTESLRDDDLREFARAELVRARQEIASRLETLRPDWPARRRTGAAVAVTALLDGLILHRVLDPELPVDAVIGALAELVRSGR